MVLFGTLQEEELWTRIE